MSSQAERQNSGVSLILFISAIGAQTHTALANHYPFRQASVIFGRHYGGTGRRATSLRQIDKWCTNNVWASHSFRQASVMFRREFCFTRCRATTFWKMANGARTNSA